MGGSGYEKPQSGLRPLCGFSTPHLGQGLRTKGTMLRIALLPAPNVIYNRNVINERLEKIFSVNGRQSCRHYLYRINIHRL
jgi:hypothetical protein